MKRNDLVAKTCTMPKTKYFDCVWNNYKDWSINMLIAFSECIKDIIDIKKGDNDYVHVVESYKGKYLTINYLGKVSK